jgi:hypothetical protein
LLLAGLAVVLLAVILLLLQANLILRLGERLTKTLKSHGMDGPTSHTSPTGPPDARSAPEEKGG